jgi:hypothetical protein
MLAISKKEWRWVMAWAATIMLVSSLPYLYGWWVSTPQMQFSGFFLGVEDANSYLAKMRMGAENGWIFHLAYTPEPHAGAYLFTFHLFLGKLARLVQFSFPLVYHLARIIFGWGLLVTVYCFISYFVSGPAQRRFAFLLAATGSGLGWLIIALQLTSRLGLPLDIYVPEAFIFLVLFHLPHLALAESLLFWAILWTLQSWQTHTWRPIFWAGGALLGVALIAAFYVGVFVAVLGLTWLILTFSARSIQKTGGLLVKLAGATALAWPVLAYDAYIFTTNPILRVWNQQNLILSPEPWHYLLAYGLLIIPAIFGVRSFLSRLWLKLTSSSDMLADPDSFKHLALILWCLVFPLLVYLPFNLQRRLVVGVQLALIILATYGLFSLSQKYIHPARQPIIRAGLLLFFGLTNIFLLLGGMVSVSLRQPPIFHPLSQLEAMRWLDEAAAGHVVLAVYETGNVLPAYTNIRAFVGHGPETVNSDEKRAQAKQFFSSATSDPWRRDLLQRFNIRYVYYGPNEKAAGEFAPGQASYLKEVYKNEEVQIFEVN